MYRIQNFTVRYNEVIQYPGASSGLPARTQGPTHEKGELPMKKRILSLLLALVMCLSVLPGAVFAAGDPAGPPAPLSRKAVSPLTDNKTPTLTVGSTTLTDLSQDHTGDCWKWDAEHHHIYFEKGYDSGLIQSTGLDRILLSVHTSLDYTQCWNSSSFDPGTSYYCDFYFYATVYPVNCRLAESGTEPLRVMMTLSTPDDITSSTVELDPNLKQNVFVSALDSQGRETKLTAVNPPYTSFNLNTRDLGHPKDDVSVWVRGWRTHDEIVAAAGESVSLPLKTSMTLNVEDLSADYRDGMSGNAPTLDEVIKLPVLHKGDVLRLKWNAKDKGDQIGTDCILYSVIPSEDGDRGSYYYFRNTPLRGTKVEITTTGQYYIEALTRGSYHELLHANIPCTLSLEMVNDADPQVDAPANFTAVIRDDGKPYLTWDAVEGADEYEIQRADGDGDFAAFFSPKATSTSLRHGSAKVGETYTYRIRAIVDGQASEWVESETVQATLAAPEISVTINSKGKPYITWTKVEGAEEYEVIYGVPSASFEHLYSTKTGLRVTHGRAKAGETYVYAVAAKANGEYGQLSQMITITTPALATPETKLANRASDGKPVLSWDKVDGADHYEVYRKVGKNGEYQLLKGDVKGTSLRNGTAKAGTTYYYYVVAVSADGGKSVKSSTRYITCDLARPDVTARLRDGKPYLTWGKVSGAIKYEVYRSVDGQGFELLTTVKGTSLRNGSAKSGQTCKYRVKAICSNKYGNSALSYIDTVTVK